MSSETRTTLLDLITTENAVLLLVDQQEGWFSRIQEPEQTRHHLRGRAECSGGSPLPGPGVSPAQFLHGSGRSTREPGERKSQPSSYKDY